MGSEQDKEILNRKIGGFKLLRRISEGGTCVVYEACADGAERLEDGLLFAVKEVPLSLVERERRISQRIERFSDYSIIVPVLRALEDPVHGKGYLVMQLRQNGMFLETLVKRLRAEHGGRIPIVCVLRMMQEILRTLYRLHSCLDETTGYEGYVHLDLHPGNIFFENLDLSRSGFGSVKLIDLLTARAIRKEGITQTDSVFEQDCDAEDCRGITPGFTAPELLYRMEQAVGRQADLYSAGAVFWYLIDPEFTDSVMEDAQEQMETLPYLLKEAGAAPLLCQFLKNVVKCAMQEQPSYRFSNAHRMLEQFEKAEQVQKYYESGAYYEALCLAFSLDIRQTGLERENEWGRQGFWKHYTRALGRLRDSLLSDAIDRSRCMYVYENLYALAGEPEQTLAPPQLALLYGSGIACLNHMGRMREALALYKKLCVYRSEIPILEWADLTNRCAASCTGLFQVEQARKLTEENLERLMRIREAYCKAAEAEGLKTPCRAVRVLPFAKACSAHGQYLAWYGREDPMPEFERALEEFGDDRGNCMITYSHILHHAIQADDLQLFEAYWKRMTGFAFQSENMTARWLEQEADGGYCSLYELWVYMKAVWSFGLEQEIPGLEEGIRALLRGRSMVRSGEYPRPAIRFYCGLILYRLEGCVFTPEVCACLEQARQQLTGGSRNKTGALTLYQARAYRIHFMELLLSQDAEGAKALYEEFMERAARDKMMELVAWNEKRNAQKKETEIPEIFLAYEYL